MYRVKKIAVVSFLFFLGLTFLPIAVTAKDEWVQVRSRNFYLVGNASEKDIRKVATRMEQFREAFRILFGGTNLSSPIPINIVVFKSDSSYKPFKPRRGDGKADTFIAGYFQPGEDVNYITLSTEGEDTDTFSTIFHEYVHSILDTNFGKSDVPTWFNEGLAEYYSTFQIEEDQKIKLGLPQSNHLNLLQQNQLIPLSSLFATSNAALHQNGGHSRTIFYAESWALVHYLIQGGKGDKLGKFLQALVRNTPAEKAFQDAFQATYADMEKELRAYVAKRSFQYGIYTTSKKLTFDAEMQASPLADADSSFYLGDLLYHTNRADDAEPFLKSTLAATPESSPANATLGMVKIRQRKYDEAKNYLEKAVSLDVRNYLALYRYAYLLSRDGRDEFGYMADFKPETAAKIREVLKKAIVANPAFTESHELFAFVSLVSGEALDEALNYLRAALKIQPGNQKYALRIAEIYGRQEKFTDARSIAEKIARTTDDDEVKQRANDLAEHMRRNEEMLAKYEEAKKAAAASGGRVLRGEPMMVRGRGKEPTPEEIERLREETMNLSINGEVRGHRSDGTEQLIGNILRIDCKGNNVTFSIKTDSGTFGLTSSGFQQLELNAYMEVGKEAEMRCGAQMANLRTVITYKPTGAPASVTKGELVAIDFVPSNFRFADPSIPAGELDDRSTQSLPPPPDASDTAPSRDYESERRSMMMASIKGALRKPSASEVQVMGFIEKSECSTKGAFFFLRSGDQILKLSTDSSKQPDLKAFTPDTENLQIGCGMKAVEIPVVFTYKPDARGKNKSQGQLLALEFVPKSFVLQ